VTLIGNTLCAHIPLALLRHSLLSFQLLSFDLDATGAYISAPLPPEAQAFRKGISGYQLPEGKRLKL
jgi:hypothetical protein